MSATPPLLLLAAGRKARPRRAPTIRPLESRLQTDVAKLLTDHCLSDWRWTHFPAGEKRDVITGARLRRFGLQKGWSDFLFISPDGQLHCLELKRIGADMTAEQEAFWRFCIRSGVPHSTCRTIDEVLIVFDRWQCLRVKIARQAHG